MSYDNINNCPLDNKKYEKKLLKNEDDEIT